MHRAWGSGYARGKKGLSDEKAEDVYWMVEDTGMLLKEYLDEKGIE